MGISKLQSGSFVDPQMMPSVMRRVLRMTDLLQINELRQGKQCCGYSARFGESTSSKI